MRILHLADVHLDRPFVGMTPNVARRRRRELWETFVSALKLARERDVDLVTIGGDLWEEEHVKLDTRRSVLHELSQLGRPVLIIAGNHDALVPGGNWERAASELPENVTLVRGAPLEPHTYDDVVVWGASWLGGHGGALRADVVRSAQVERTRHNVLLLHGTLMSTLFADESSYCPFREEDVADAGFDLCLAGHIHKGQQAGLVVYPGSVEPLDPSEQGRHCVAIVDVGAGGVSVELVEIARYQYVDVEISCDGAGSSAEITTLVRERLAALGDTTYVRAYLRGAISASIVVDTAALRAANEQGLAGLTIVDETRDEWDVERISKEPTVRGAYVKRLLDRLEQTPPEEHARIELAIELGLRAFDTEAEVVHAL